MYMSVSDASIKFNVSKRRVQTLCEQGRISGATMVSGVWLIPKEAKKPVDARKKKQISTIRKVNKTSKELTFKEVCEMFSISTATARNWIRLGKLKTIKGKDTFDKNYIDNIIEDIKSGNDSRLKSRRNKKSLTGNILYKDYIKNEHNRLVIEEILNTCDNINESELRIIIANFAKKIYKDIGLKNNKTFKALIDELTNCDISIVDYNKISIALDKKLEFQKTDDTLGFAYISLRDLSKRKQTGAYYTPEKIVNTLLDSLFECDDLNGKTILDPCCGTGNFLIGLLNRGINARMIYGQDIDEISVLITRINLFLLDSSLTKKELENHIICNDALKKTFDKKFSIVLGNPPWGYDFKDEQILYLSKKYKTAKKGMESYDLFLELSLSLVGENGYIAYVLPEAFMNVATHSVIRKILLDNCSFKFVCYIGNAFTGVLCPSIILGLKKDNLKQNIGCKIITKNNSFIIKKPRELNENIFSLNINDDEYDCIKHIENIKNTKYLLNNAKFALGIVTGNNKKYITTKKTKHNEIVLKGSNIYKYSVNKIDNYIEYRPELFQQVAPTEMYRAKEKLLYRFISEVPVFAYDNKQMLSLNSCNILIPKIKGLSIKYILAILNSSVAAFYINKKFNSVKLLRSHIESLPILYASKKEQKEIEKMVDSLIKAKKNIDILYEKLDDYIMKLYNLNDVQINTIKTALKEKNKFLCC